MTDRPRDDLTWRLLLTLPALLLFLVALPFAQTLDRGEGSRLDLSPAGCDFVRRAGGRIETALPQGGCTIRGYYRSSDNGPWVAIDQGAGQRLVLHSAQVVGRQEVPFQAPRSSDDLFRLGTFVGCFAGALLTLLVAWTWPARRSSSPHSLAAEFGTAFRRGFKEGWYGFWAPLRLRPWKAFFRAARTPGASWSAPFTAFLDEVDALIRRQSSGGSPKDSSK